ITQIIHDDRQTEHRFKNCAMLSPCGDYEIEHRTSLKIKPRHEEDILNKLVLEIIHRDPRLFKKYIILQKETNSIKKERLINELIDELVETEKLLRNNPVKKRLPNNQIKYKSEQERSKKKQDVKLGAKIALEKLINGYLETLKTWMPEPNKSEKPKSAKSDKSEASQLNWMYMVRSCYIKGIKVKKDKNKGIKVKKKVYEAHTHYQKPDNTGYKDENEAFKKPSKTTEGNFEPDNDNDEMISEGDSENVRILKKLDLDYACNNWINKVKDFMKTNQEVLKIEKSHLSEPEKLSMPRPKTKPEGPSTMKQKREEISKTEVKLARPIKETNTKIVEKKIGGEKGIRIAVDKYKTLRYANRIVQGLDAEEADGKKAFKQHLNSAENGSGGISDLES
ncbi:6668_t:CDS:2, partial [Scutellospora calospora]